MAGCRAVEEMLAARAARFDITVFGAEPHGNYNRIMLSPVLAGEKTLRRHRHHDRDWYASNGIELIAGDAVDGDRPRAPRSCAARTGTSGRYDLLLLATGSDPVIVAASRCTACPA